MMRVSDQLRSSEFFFCNNSKQSSADQSPLAAESLAVLGHEIRNPLSALSYALQAWPTSNDDPQLTEQLLQIMRRQVIQLTRLSNDLLDTGRSTRGDLTICRAALDVRAALQNACEEIQPLAERRGHTMSVEFGDLPLTLFGDESRLTQVFANVMQNSVKFTDRGGHLQFSLERDRNTAIVRLSDNGRGICSDRLLSIFRADNISKACSQAVGEGLGIGLRLAKSIVELHGGTIEAFSEGLGHGCTFLIRLPIVSNIPTDVNNASTLPCAAVRENDSQLPHYRIVVVDDDRSMRFLLSRLLQSLNQSVTTAENFDTAIEAISRLRPHVVFLDLQMHGMSGYEVARQIRSRAELSGVVLVALSGNADTPSRKRAAESGFDQYLVKPTSMGELTDSLRNVCALSAC